MRQRLLILILLTCSACGGRGGYVESDIPGVATGLAAVHQGTVSQQCPPGSIAPSSYANVSQYTTEVEFHRQRVDLGLRC